MLKKYLIISFLILIITYPVFSDDKTTQNYQRIIDIDSEIYTLLDFITAESWMSVSSNVKPYSEAEVLNILDGIDYPGLSSPGKSAFDRIRKLMEKTPILSEDNIALEISPGAAAELYLHTSDDESIWEYGYEERIPVLTLPVEVWFNEGFYAVMENSIEYSRYKITDVDSDGNYIGNLTNIPIAFGDINYHFPQRAFLSAGGENWNFQIGRDQLEFGNGESGKLMLSSYSDYYDMIKLKGFSDNFSFTWTYINLQSWADSDDGDNMQRAFVDHVLEVRPFEWLTLYLNEAVMFYGEDPELQFISPLLVYHNLFMRESANSLAGAGFRLVPLPGLTLYGELVVDQLQTGLEQELYGEGVTATPNADGHMLGLKASYPLGPGYVSGFFEYIYTSPWMYLRSPEGVSFYWSHRETTDILNARVTVIKPLGYEYGPDTISFAGEAGYTLPGIFSAFISADFIMNGENTIETAYTEGADAALMTTPSGTPENKLVLGIRGNYRILSFLSAQLDLAYVDIYNYEHVSGAAVSDFQSAVSLIFQL